ncbi:MAG: DUF2232 domain-containing protein [Ktedonobacterales bacterium]
MPEQASEIDDIPCTAEIDTLVEPAELLKEGRIPGSPAYDSDTTPGIGWLTATGLAEGGLLADVGIVLDLASIYLPLVGTILSFAVPTPFAILMLRRGTRVTLLAAAVATFLITVLSGPHFGWRMGLEAILGLLLGWAMRSRMRPILAFAGGTLLVAAVTFVAALGVILVTGLPISDVVSELRNAMASAAGLVAAGAAAFGFESQWLAIRPSLVAVGLLGLHVWPILLFLTVAASAFPVVACYYALANATAQVLGHDVRAFPPRSFMHIVRLVVLLVTLPIALPLRALGWLLHQVHKDQKVESGSPEDD